MQPVLTLIVAHICSMLGFATFAALLPQLRDEWSLTNAQAGLVGGMFFGGYVVSVSYWTALTDRSDGRKVYAAASVFAAAASAGFGWLARGFGSALFFQALLGVGIAGTYMPGLRLLSDRVSGPQQSRSIAFYTASFGIGTALSLALAGAVAPRAGWKAAFLVSAIGPLIAGNEVALRVGRRRWILLAMAASGASGIVLGLSARWHWAVVLTLLAAYSMMVMAESATLTAGLVAASPPELRGSAMGLYSLAGFGGGMLGPVIFGAALDMAGGAGSAPAWVAAY